MTLVPVADLRSWSEMRAASIRSRAAMDKNAVPDHGIDLKRPKLLNFTAAPTSIGPTETASANPKSWQRFVVGSCNAEAVAALRAPLEFMNNNPLIIYGDPGTGKTHALRAFCAEMRGIYHPIEELEDELKGPPPSFDKSIPLAIDDLGFASRQIRDRAAHIIGAGITAGQRIVISSSVLLVDGRDRLANLATQGLKLRIGRPDRITREAILRMAIADTMEQYQGFSLSEDVIAVLVGPEGFTCRELIGALGRVLASWQRDWVDPSIEAAQSAIEEFVLFSKTRRYSIKEIQRFVAKTRKVSLNELLSARRTHRPTRARQEAMLLVKDLTQKSLPEIGRHFGGRDHTTVIHAIGKIERLMKEDSEYREEIAAMKLQLLTGVEP